MNGTRHVLFILLCLGLLLSCDNLMFPPPDVTYTVTYNTNGATGGSVPIDSNPYGKENYVTLLGNTGNLIKTNYTFAGWNTKADGSGTSYAAGATFQIGTANVTLYAVWAPAYTVTYDANGADSGSVPTDTNSYPQGAIIIVLSNTGTLTKASYTFAGWNSAADASGTSHAAGTGFTMGAANVTLYAVWTQNPTYTVTYNSNFATGGSVPTDSNNYLQGATVTVLVNTGSLVRTNYTFVGWNTAANGSGTSYATAATFTMGTANVTLYAVWTPTYTVTYNANGSTGGGVPTDGNRYQQGATVTVLGNTGTLVKTNYTFAGWNTANNGTGTSYAAAAIFTMGSANVTLYAVWTLNPTYTVTYDGNLETGGSVPTNSNSYQQGATFTVAGNTGSLTKMGYAFTGWNTAFDGSGTSYAASSTFTMGSANATLYAVWTIAYTVTYDPDAATGGSVPTDSVYHLQGATITVQGNTGSLTKSGYALGGWNTADDGSGTSYGLASASFTMGSADVTLYPVWIPSNLNFTSSGTNISISSSPSASGAVTIPMGVTRILGSAFNGCTGLTGVTIPSSVTSIGTAAFQGCTGLTSITLPASVTSIGTQVFAWCSSLATVTFSAPSTITTIGDNLFVGCTVLSSLTLPSGITSIGSQAFANCAGLNSTNFSIPSTVTSIGNSAFRNCTGLTNVTIPSGVSSIGDYVFDGNTGLTSITIPSSVTSIGIAAFQGCTHLPGVTLPPNLTSIGDSAFAGCTLLNNLTLPANLTSIGGAAFQNCTHLAGALIIPASVTNIGGAAFQNCIALTSVTIPPDMTSITPNLFFGCAALTGFTIPSTVTSIGNYAFASSGLTSIVIPASVTSIGTYAFHSCYGLASVTISGSSLTSIGEAAFAYCSNAGLTTIALPSSVTSIGYSAFASCTGLTNMTIPSNVTSLGGAVFYGCNHLGSVTILANLTSIPTNSFDGCAALTSITIPSTVTSIGGWAFRSCTLLASVTIPSGVTSIGDYAFDACSGLTAVTIPSTVTSIGGYAFRNCWNTSLTNITIPANVTSIGTFAFYGCGYLASVTVLATTPPALPALSYAFSSCAAGLQIHVPATTALTYQNTTGWNQYNTIIN